MSDPLIPAVPAVNAIVSVASASTGSPQQEAAAADNPFGHLPLGSSVEGYVINRDPQNNPILRTPLGDVVVQSDVFLKTGSTVILRVDASKDSPARIVTVDGLSAEDYAAQATSAPAEDTIAPNQLQQATRNFATAQISDEADQPKPVLQAVVLQPNFVGPASNRPASAPAYVALAQQAADPIPQGLTQLPPGTALTFTVIDIELPPVPVSLAAIPQATLPAALFSSTSLPAQPTTVAAPAAQPAPSANATALPVTLQNGPAAPAAPLATATAIPVSTQTVVAEPGAGGVNTAANAPTPVPANFAQASTNPPPATNTASPVIAANTVPPALVAPASAALLETSPTGAASTQPAGPGSAVPAPPVANTPAAVSVSAPVTIEPPASSAASAAATIPAAMPPNSSAIPLTALQAIAPAANTAPYAAPQATEATVQFAPAPAATALMPDIRATVIGHEADGTNIVQTAFASVKLYTPQPLPTGTTLIVQVGKQGGTVAAPNISPLPDALASITGFTRDWQNLVDTLSALQAGNPDLARAVIQQVPSASTKLTSNMLFFLSAVKSGKLADWLGTGVADRLDGALPHMAALLGQDIQKMQQLFTHSPLADWSGVMVPMLFGQEMHQMRFYVRNEEEKSTSAVKSSGGHRFIVECDLSQIGELQLDGFVRSGEKAKSFDLIIRTNGALPPEVSQGIRQAFTAALQTTNLTGQLAFQQGQQHFIRPLASGQAPSSGVAPQPILA